MSDCIVDCSSVNVFATLYNTYRLDQNLIKKPSIKINLDPILISYLDFRNLFYPNETGSFYLNPIYCSCPAISFQSQTITDQTGTQQFNLIDYVLAGYEEYLQISRDCFNPCNLIKLTKDLCRYKSLCDTNCGSFCTLTWKDILCVLEANNSLITNKETNCFQLIFNYYNPIFCDVAIEIIFNYYVKGIEADCYPLPNPCYLKIEGCDTDDLTTTLISNSDLANGTYRITTPGIYKLNENIVFLPNPDNNCLPKYPEQAELYPITNGYILGFFAVFTIESECVEFDLNGYSIELSEEFYCKMRFCALIELANSPFIPPQGPANFGKNFKAASKCTIKNGFFKKSSHHGIHGNHGNNIIISNLVFSNYDVAAIHLNGASNVSIEDCECLGTSTDIPMLSTFSHAKFDLPHLKRVVASNPTCTLSYNDGNVVPISEIQTELEAEIADFESFCINGTPYEGIFKNPFGISDCNVYGIVLNTNGVAVNAFKPLRPENAVGNKNIVISNTKINQTNSRGTEIIGINKTQSNVSPDGSDGAYGKKEFVGPVGDVWNVSDSTNEEGIYKGTIISNTQMVIAKCGTTKEELGTTNIPEEIYKSVTGFIDNNSKLTDITSETIDPDFPYYFIYGRDSMSHVMKGNIGLFIQQGEEICLDNVNIDGVENTGVPTYYKSTTIIPDQLSAQSIGLAIIGCTNMKVNDNVTIENIVSSNSFQLPVLKQDSKCIQLPESLCP